MDPSPLGDVTFGLWKEIPAYFPYVVLDEFLLMPDHLHGIIEIDKPTDNDSGRGEINRSSTDVGMTAKTGGITGNKNPMLHQNL